MGGWVSGCSQDGTEEEGSGRKVERRGNQGGWGVVEGREEAERSTMGGGVTVNAGHCALAGSQAAKPRQLVSLCVTDLINHKPCYPHLPLQPSLSSCLFTVPTHGDVSYLQFCTRACGGSTERSRLFTLWMKDHSMRVFS